MPEPTTTELKVILETMRADADRRHSEDAQWRGRADHMMQTLGTRIVEVRDGLERERRRVDKIEQDLKQTDQRARHAQDSHAQLQGEVIGIVSALRTEIKDVAEQVKPVVEVAPLIKDIRDEQVARAARRLAEAAVRAEAEAKEKAERDAADAEERKKRLELQARRTFILKLVAVLTPIVGAVAGVVTAVLLSHGTTQTPAPTPPPSFIDAGR